MFRIGDAQYKLFISLGGLEHPVFCQRSRNTRSTKRGRTSIKLFLSLAVLDKMILFTFVLDMKKVML